MSAFAGLVHFGAVAPGEALGRQLAAGLVGQGFSASATIRLFPTAGFAYRPRLTLAGDDRDGASGWPENGASVSLFDGRLDNPRLFLDADPSECDADLAGRAYRRWGAEAPRHLLGDFAWAVWDPHEQRLLLARDHSFHRALFYYPGDGWVAFATTYRALFALPGVPRELDEDRIVDLIATTADTSDRTLYKAVRWVRPAEMVVITRAGIRQERFWRPEWRPERRARSGPTGDLDILEEARDLFDQAVACRDRSAGPPTILLSGGLDSAAVAATLARRRAPAPVHGLTGVPAEGLSDTGSARHYFDERPFVASLAAEHANLVVDHVTPTGTDPWEEDPTTLFLAADGPLRGPANAAWFHPLLARAGALGAPVVLSGGFGNLTYSANGFSRLGELLAGGSAFGFLGEILAMRRHMPHGEWAVHGRAVLGRRLPWLRAAIRRLSGRDWSSEWRRRTVLNPAMRADPAFRAHFIENAVISVDGGGPDGRFQELAYLLERSRLQVESRAAVRAATGIDMWDPFADRRIIDFCLSLPEDQFFRNGQPRSLARRVFADRLPAGILSNQRRGVQNADWHLRLPQQRERLEATLDQLDRSALAGRILDLPRLRRMLREMPADPDALRRTGNAYKVMFTRAIHVGRFLAWYERVN